MNAYTKNMFRFRYSIYLLFILGVFSFFPSAARAFDADGDGLSDEDEFRYYTDVWNPDTDADGYPDGVEVAAGYSPLKRGLKLTTTDYDGDGLSDALEVRFGTDMGKTDTDGDGMSDREEILRGADPATEGHTQVFDRKIVIDLTMQQLRYMVDQHEFFQFPVSTGNPWTPTPVGTFAVQRKVPIMPYIGPGYNWPRVKWNLQFLPHYYIHTAYWHNDFGKRTRSHGCVNMREADVATLYPYIDVGVPVEIIGETPKNLFVAGVKR